MRYKKCVASVGKDGNEGRDNGNIVYPDICNGIVCIEDIDLLIGTIRCCGHKVGR